MTGVSAGVTEGMGMSEDYDRRIVEAQASRIDALETALSDLAGSVDVLINHESYYTDEETVVPDAGGMDEHIPAIVGRDLSSIYRAWQGAQDALCPMALADAIAAQVELEREVSS